jgi:hypothetical protein
MFCLVAYQWPHGRLSLAHRSKGPIQHGRLTKVSYKTTLDLFIRMPYEVAIFSGENARFSGIPGQVAYDCLRSMPFYPELAAKFLDEYVKYLQFHATIDALKGKGLFQDSKEKRLGSLTLPEPPSSYISTSVNLLRDIERIRSKATRNLYSSQYDFDSDLRYLVSRANDGHLGLELCSLSVMHFEHGVPLVSLSRDGLELPQIYTYCT